MLLIDFRLRALNPSYLFVGDLICRVINVCKDLHRDAQYVVSISADICYFLFFLIIIIKHHLTFIIIVYYNLSFFGLISILD